MGAWRMLRDALGGTKSSPVVPTEQKETWESRRIMRRRFKVSELNTKLNLLIPCDFRAINATHGHQDTPWVRPCLSPLKLIDDNLG